MGVCEGFPNSIMPDENGRADYHGASVNLAARFMSAGVGRLWAQGRDYEKRPATDADLAAHMLPRLLH